jgi:hypothetical protein
MRILLYFSIWYQSVFRSLSKPLVWLFSFWLAAPPVWALCPHGQCLGEALKELFIVIFGVKKKKKKKKKNCFPCVFSRRFVQVGCRCAVRSGGPWFSGEIWKLTAFCGFRQLLWCFPASSGCICCVSGSFLYSSAIWGISSELWAFPAIYGRRRQVWLFPGEV